MLSCLTPQPTAESWHERAALVRSAGMGALAGMVVPRWFTLLGHFLATADFPAA